AFEGGAGEDRLPHDAVLPGDEAPLRVQPRFQRVVVHRTVVARAHVVLPRPHELYRSSAADGFRDLRRLDEVIRVRIGAPPAAAACEAHAELELPWLHSED